MTEPTSDLVKRILVGQFGVTGWDISMPEDGWSGATCIAQWADALLFIKLDVVVPILQRLADLGIAPPILKSGVLDGRTFVIQEYIEGTYPERGWFATQLRAVAHLIRGYQQDAVIRTFARVDEITGQRDLAERLEGLKERLAQASSAFRNSQRKRMISNFFAQAETLGNTPLVFTHGDPSRKNFLLTGDHIYLVDWDESGPADPLRDIGPLLWWYVPSLQWPSFFTAYGLPMTEPILARLYWWVAEESLDIALALEERGYREGVREFLEDFAAALRGEGNPRAI